MHKKLEGESRIGQRQFWTNKIARYLFNVERRKSTMTSTTYPRTVSSPPFSRQALGCGIASHTRIQSAK
jgi:hypothetical protein